MDKAMKQIMIAQNSVGRYNLMSNEDSYSFAALIKEDGETLTRDGVKAVLSFRGEPDDKPDFDYMIEVQDWGGIFDKCFGYVQRVISTQDYEAEALLFASEYINSFDEISETTARLKKERLEREMETIRRKLEGYLGLDDSRDGVRDTIQGRIDLLTKWLTTAQQEASQCVEGSELWVEKNKTINRYLVEIERLERVIK